MSSYASVAGTVAWRHLNIVKNPALFLPPLVFPLLAACSPAGSTRSRT